MRQAIAWCMDRNQILAEYTGNFGLRADSYYGIGQWMYGLVSGTVAFPVDPPEEETDTAAMAEYEKELEAWEELTLDNLVDYEADMIYVASNFDEVFDPSAHFLTDAEGRHSWSFTNGVDEEMYEKTVDMIRTEPGETLEYVRKWIAFLEYFNRKLPMIPVYTNIYFDFYTDWLQNYEITQNTTWAQAILGATLEEPVEEEVTMEDGEEIFE